MVISEQESRSDKEHIARADPSRFSKGLSHQYSMPCSLYWSRDKRGNAHESNLFSAHPARMDERIINCQLSIAAKKDFNEEIRALIDVRKFVADSFIMTDISEVRIGRIVEHMIESLAACRNLDDDFTREAKELLFVEKSPIKVLLANTMQGLYVSSVDGRLAYDNSWVLATGNLVSIQRRLVAIARFPQPVNFGSQSQEVRFLIIVLAPNREKLTKNAWETGRTFATMFSDINFRRRLLRAKSHDEFRMELLAQAEALARHSELGNQENNNNTSHNDQTTQITSDFQLNLPPNSKEACSNLARRHTGVGGNAPSGQEPNQPEAPSSFLGPLGSGLIDDLKRRAAFYLSDFKDGVIGDRSFYKTFSTTIFLYFSVLLPCIAFGVVDTSNTEGQIDPKKTMIGQAIGGILFALLSGQPLVVIMTTAPLCIYVKVIYQISQDLDVEFGAFYACVGLWMSFFLLLYSVTNLSNLMRFCTRSTEDIFALFTALAFGSDGIKEALRSFNKYYWEPDCMAGVHQQHLTGASISIVDLAGSHELVAQNSHNQHHQLAPHPSLATHQSAANGSSLLLLTANSNLSSSIPSLIIGGDYSTTYNTTSLPTLSLNATDSLNHHDLHSLANEHLVGSGSVLARCQRETCVLFLFLMFGTLWLANSFSSFDKTPYLSSRKREVLKDYALAISVLIFSFIGSYVFFDIRLDVFEFSDFTGLHFPQQLSQLPLNVILAGSILGFMLSVLFYIDQNICGAMVNNAPYKLKKGDYFHLDLFVVAILNALLSLVGLPFMHGKLPHSHLHSKALADYEERVDEGHVHQTIVNIRETRLTCLFCSALIGLSLLAVPYPISYIPLPVLSGVFLYTALAEFKSNSMIERVCLLFTEQAAYPPNHYIRRCPQRKIHLFTITQLAQLLIVSFVGFYPNPYVNMAFPLAVAAFVPIRTHLIPFFVDSKYLNSLDKASYQ